MNITPPTSKRDDEHTPITSEILEVIDQADSSRYKVALRLTRWYEAKTKAARNELVDALAGGLPEKDDSDYPPKSARGAAKIARNLTIDEIQAIIAKHREDV